MKKESRFSLPTVGIASLVVIFGVLCLTVFALLAITTVQSELRLAENTRQAIDGYYEADFTAHQILARLRAGEIPEGVSQEDNIFQYSCPISPTQSLSVQVQLQGQSYFILQWQAVSTTQWQPDTDLPVWDGEQPGKED